MLLLILCHGMQIFQTVFSDIIPENLNFYQKKKFLRVVKRYFWDKPYCSDDVLMTLLGDVYRMWIFLIFLKSCHFFPVRGHHAGDLTAKKIL